MTERPASPPPAKTAEDGVVHGGPSTPAITVPAGFVLGTAGHIDHGKSTLVRALTGIDPDRLEEEKRRGMTIDLGFAYLDLKSGRRIGIVDVPGHQRFIKNMLAGVHGFDGALLVVAADEGVMPQTREHLDILDLLGIGRGVVALTKSDLVDEDWLALVAADVQSGLRSTSLAGAAIVPCSATTGAGLDELVAALERILTQASPRADLGRPRLPIDRAFVMQGFGTVVTGTLAGGTLAVGEEVELLPAGKRARLRGLQQHNQRVDRASPGNRTAVNLSGVAHTEVQRGDVLARPGTFAVSRRADIQVRVLRDSPFALKHRARVVVYLGTAELFAQVVLLDGDALAPGERGWAQVYFDGPVPMMPTDRLILRLPAPPTTLAGGIVVDTGPQRHRRRDPALLASLERRAQGDASAGLREELAKHAAGARTGQLAAALGADATAVRAALQSLAAQDEVVAARDIFLTRAHWQAWADRLREALAAYHAAFPLRAGMAREELRSRTGIPGELLAPALARLAEAQTVVEDGREVRLSQHRAALPPAEESTSLRLVQELEAGGFAPPTLAELASRYPLTPALLEHLVAQGRLVRVSEEVVFARAAYDRAVDLLARFIRRNGSVTVAQARDLLGSSRKFVLPLLEWLDAQKITRRVGDDRILR